MNFQKRKIGKGKKISISLGIFTSVAVILLLFIGIVKAVSKIDIGVFLKVAGTELKTDAYGHTNFLLLGTGGKFHDGGNLTDTIMIASLDNEQKVVTMVSLPRDTWVNDNTIGNSKINEVYFKGKNYFGSSREGLDHMKKKVETLMGIPIHYWAKIDFKGFTELIDAIGGIDVFVETTINDPYYPKDGTVEYEPFYISAGEHNMDGATALKYARSRKTTSDFDRANRQQKIIYAIKEKALQTNTIFSSEKIRNILDTLKENIKTNITVKEILTLGSIAKNYSSGQISHRLIHDDPTQCGGFFYTPERSYYGGLFVLIPAGGFKFIHLYSDLNFNLPYIAQEKAKIHILNGTKTIGVAGETKQILNRFCFNINRFGNAHTKENKKTKYYYQGERPATLDFLQKIAPGEEITEIPIEYQEYMTETDIIFEIGSDYVNSKKYLEDPFYSLATLYPATTTTDEN